jgi:hypothetical protein
MRSSDRLFVANASLDVDHNERRRFRLEECGKVQGGQSSVGVPDQHILGTPEMPCNGGNVGGVICGGVGRRIGPSAVSVPPQIDQQLLMVGQGRAEAAPEGPLP